MVSHVQCSSVFGGDANTSRKDNLPNAQQGTCPYLENTMQTASRPASVNRLPASLGACTQTYHSCRDFGSDFWTVDTTSRVSTCPFAYLSACCAYA